MIVPMSETSASPEPTTGPVVTPPPAQPVVREEPRRSKATLAAAWVGIVAGVVFIVAVIFFSGFILGAQSSGHRGGHGGPGGDGGMAFIHRGPPPPGMFPMMPRGEFGPGPGFGPGGPRFEPPQPPQSPGATTTPSRP